MDHDVTPLSPQTTVIRPLGTDLPNAPLAMPKQVLERRPPEHSARALLAWIMPRTRVVGD